MSSFKYVPKACTAESPTWEGSVEIKSQTFDEACDISEKLTMSLVGVPDEIKDTRRLREIVKIVAPLVLAVDLKRLKDGKEFKSWDELRAKTLPFLAEIAAAAMNGSDVGNG